MSTQPRTCATCDRPIYARNRSGYCVDHFRSSPEQRRKVSESLRRGIMLDPARKDQLRRAGCASAATPAQRERRSRDARERNFHALGVAAQTDETRAKIGASVSATKLAWCPPHLRAMYRNLTGKQRLTATEARALVLEHEAAEMARWRRSVGAA